MLGTNVNTASAARFLFGCVLLSLVPFFLPVSSAAAPTNKVAVADFELRSAARDARDWAFGLADLLAVELQQRGVTLFERQQLRIVLGERQLTASGLMKLGRDPAHEIPDLQYLVSGVMTAFTNRQFHLEISLLDTRTGRTFASFSREGQYPNDLTKALANLAEQLVTPLTAAGLDATPLHDSRPYNRKPEATLPFYKGVAYCLSGHPEMGVSWFMDAWKADPQFLAAGIWIMRAFQMMGLPDFAEVARAKVQTAPNGPAVLNQLNAARLLDQKLVSIAIIPAIGLDASGLQFQTRLKTELGRDTNIFVADPANIRSLAAEMDLQLTERGPRDLESASLLWSAMDLLVLLSAGEDSVSGSLQVEVRHAVSGQSLFRARTPGDLSKAVGIARELAKVILGRQKEAGTENQRMVRGKAESEWSIPSSNEASREHLAKTLRHIVAHPSDRAALMQLGGLGTPYQCLVADRVVAATRTNSTDAAQWLARAFWHRRYHEGTNQPIAVAGASLLRGYPATPEAKCVRGALAMELVNQQKYREAAAIFLELAPEVEHFSTNVIPALNFGPRYVAFFYFFTAATLQQLGDGEGAKKFLGQTAEVLRKKPYIGLYGLGPGSPFPDRHILFGPDRTIRQAVVEWQARLNPVAYTNGAAMTLQQFEELLTQIIYVPTNEIAPKRIEFLQRLIEHKRAHPELYQGRITRSVYAWGPGVIYGSLPSSGKLVLTGIYFLTEMGGSPEQITQKRRLAEALAEGLYPSLAAMYLEIAGEYERALQKIEEGIAHPTPFPPGSNDGHPTGAQTERADLRSLKIRLLGILGKPQAAAAYALAEAQKPEPDADAALSATADAVKTCEAIGHIEEVCRVLSAFIKAQETNRVMNIQSAKARFLLARYEADRGNRFEASELLREIVRQSMGKPWRINTPEGSDLMYGEALAWLERLRISAPFPVKSNDWDRWYEILVPTPIRPKTAAALDSTPSEMERELRAILEGKVVGPNNKRVRSDSEAQAFVKKYGHQALPLVLEVPRELGSYSFHLKAHYISALGILDGIVTPADAPLVLETFKSVPELAETAFRLDFTNALTILDERVGVFAKGVLIPTSVWNVMEKYHLKQYYPVLIANMDTKQVTGGMSPYAMRLERILQQDAPELMESFRSTLASLVQKQMLLFKGYHDSPGVDLGETALRNGIPLGIEALLRKRGLYFTTNALPVLRKYIDLPADEAEARKIAESGLGKWQWDVKSHKYVIGGIPGTIEKQE